MHDVIAALLDRHDSGQVSRRELIQALAALAVAAPSVAASEPTFKGAGLNHLALRVTDIPRSKAFYQRLLGAPVMTESAGSCFLKLGDEFLALFRGPAPGLDHYCFEIENFRPDEVMSRLTARGLQPRRPSGTDRIYFRDPDGLEVQLSAVGHAA